MPAPLHWSHDVLASLRDASGTSLIFEHFGPFGHDVAERLLRTAEAASLASDDPLPLRKRLVMVLAEGSENLHLHVPAEHRASSFMVLLRTIHGYSVIVGNALPQADAQALLSRVGELNALDDALLKRVYIDVLTNGQRTQHGGAGLGMLAMARRSLRPLVARTLPLDDGSSYFMLELVITLS
jgi:hypothetical protein